ncbi:SufB/SufD family protein [Peptoniphilus catoniae]|uniref:SufB/SufD family protein n=1 Tax=Peptoniphilus catoniae TaxID=1660341 RepID=UPI0010FD4480|nr:SufD family Fe-S cluster assembly protein [Peptoniphilus catoniae]
MNSTVVTNKLTFKTFNYLNVNDSKIELPELKNIKLSIESDKADDFLNRNFYKNEKEELPKDILDLNRNNCNLFKIHKSNTENSTSKVIIKSDDISNQVIDSHYVVSEKDETLNLILDYESSGNIEKFRSSLIKIYAKENSKINVFIIQNEDNEHTSIETIYVNIQEGASVNIHQFELGSSKLYTYLQSDLMGEHSNFNVNSIYFGSGSNEIDMLYNVFHYGKDSKSNIVVNGALKDKSKKIFRSTLDFKKGSSFSTGSEEEYAILLDDDVESISVPVLLSHEDNVEGNHAASAGNVDDDLMFYIMSRGFDEESSKSIIIQSKFSSAINSLEDENFKKVIWDRVFEKVRGSRDVR